MTAPTSDEGRLDRGPAALVRRAVGTEALAREIAALGAAGDAAKEAILSAILHLRQRAAEDRTRQTDEIERGLHSALTGTEQTLHQTLAHLDERAAQFHAGVLAALDRVTEQAHAVAAHLDQRVEHLLGRMVADVQARVAQLDTSFVEQRRLQNRYFSRDSLPSALAVKQYYLQLKALPELCDMEDAGVSVFSQNTEDGVILYIFAIIGMTTKRCVEIGCDLGGSTVGIPEGNTINLICNFGFDGLIVDMDPDKTAAIRHFFAQALATKHYHRPATAGQPAGYFSPTVLTRQVTAENINAVFTGAGFTGDIDLLSIDVDGPDISLWEAVRDLSPRVVVIEVNNRLRFDQVVVGGYATSSASADTLEHQQSRSSSLAAMCRLGEQKQYVFVGMDATLLNAFFVRRDAWDERLPARTPADYVSHRLNPLLSRPA